MKPPTNTRRHPAFSPLSTSPASPAPAGGQLDSLGAAPGAPPHVGVSTRLSIWVRAGLLAAAMFPLAASATACVPVEAVEDEDEGTEGDRLARESGFGADPDYVVRQRVVFEKEDVDVARFERQPFSHRARKWHVYPMTVYPGARIGFRLQVEDRAMASDTEMRVYGPALSDGAFPKAKTVMTDRGQATIEPGALEAGRYVVVVGPRDKQGFAPRYPGNVVVVKLAGSSEPVEMRLTLGADGWTASSTRGTYRVLDPAPLDPQLTSGSASLRLKSTSPGGRDVEGKVVAWENQELYSPAHGEEGASFVGRVDDDTLVLRAPEGERRLLIQQVARVGRAGEPILFQVLPQSIAKDADVPASFRGASLKLQRELDCRSDECHVPVMVNEDAPRCGEGRRACALGTGCIGGRCLRRIPSTVLSSIAESYKPLFIDPSEPSTYSLEVSCGENCMPTPVDRTRMTKYPVYFAHGFNSSRDTWVPVLDFLKQVPGFRDRSSAESVPPFEPLEARTDRLRQRLGAFIRAMEEGAPLPDGETMRVNVVAHSMGGLDMRNLISSPRFNESCAESRCEDVVDEKTGRKAQVSCCAPSIEDGAPTMWRDRVASVTTLSTPHRGSSFASWGLRQLEGTLSAGLRLVAERFFGLNEAGYDGFRRTIDALSTERGAEREGSLRPPNPARVYTWACATGQERCVVPAGSEAPPKGADGRFVLPPPTDRPTVFSWAAMACATGGCGNVLDPTLILPYSVMAAAGEKKNDGVVGVDRARYGIFMGTLAADHFDWTRPRETSSAGKRALASAFGIKNEPIERFHQVWIERLAQAGY